MQKKFLSLFVVAAFIFSFVTVAQAQNYKLEKVVVLSRHNIRAPMADKNSALSKLTPHEWFEWTSKPKELSMRGGLLETEMGQYFRKWLASEDFMPENYLPAEGEVKFYANARQRTVATAQYFSSGMLPVANVRIEHQDLSTGQMDPVFNPQLTFVNDKFRAEALKQTANIYNKTKNDLTRDYALLENVLDMKKSASARNGVDSFNPDDYKVIFKVNREPEMGGSLKLANTASDALILQYYEEPSADKAAFGHKLNAQQWEQISQVKDIYGDVLFTAPIVAVNVANPLLKEMREELKLDGRKFTFLCGHDSNIASVLAALDVEEYFLPDAIEKKTPIGSKVVIEKRIGTDGKEYAALKLVYLSTTQLRNFETLTLNNPPKIYPLRLKGLQVNDDGFYLFSDVIQRFDDTIAAYDKLKDL